MEKKTGRPPGVKIESDFKVFIYNKNRKIEEVCTLPARGKDKAESKAQDFCMMFGYNYSHVLKCI